MNEIRIDATGQPRIQEGDRWRLAAERKCVGCGVKFYANKYKIKKGEGLFHDKACHVQYLHRNHRRVVVKCKICKLIRTVPASRKGRYATCGRPVCQKILRRRQALKRWREDGFGAASNRLPNGKYC